MHARPALAAVVLLGLSLLVSSCLQQQEEPAARYGPSVAGARNWLADARSGWRYEENDYLKTPEASWASLRGDCDDFAVMVAAYMQEAWGFDTFVALLRDVKWDRQHHAVAFVDAEAFPADVVAAYICPNEPTLREPSTGRLYRPLDWDPCSNWTWNDYELGLPLYHYPSGLVLMVYCLEWYDALNYRMSAGE